METAGIGNWTPDIGHAFNSKRCLPNHPYDRILETHQPGTKLLK